MHWLSFTSFRLLFCFLFAIGCWLYVAADSLSKAKGWLFIMHMVGRILIGFYFQFKAILIEYIRIGSDRVTTSGWVRMNSFLIRSTRNPIGLIRTRKCPPLEFGYRSWDPVARKLIRSRNVVFLEDRIVGDAGKSDASWSSLEIPIILTSVSPSVIYDDHRGDGEDNNDGPIELVEQEPLEPRVVPLVELELRRSTKERWPSTGYLPHEYVMLIDGGRMFWRIYISSS